MPLTLRAHVKCVQFGYPAELWASKEMNRTNYCLSLGSMASLMPSPNRLYPSTVIKIAMPGKKESHQLPGVLETKASGCLSGVAG